MRGRIRFVGAWTLGVLALACSGQPSEAGRMRAEIEPHLDALAEYDRWARRLALAGAAFRSEEALEEAAFAPLREREDVRAAWLDRVGPDARSIRYPASAPALSPNGWTTVQTERLGELTAQRRAIEIDGERVEAILIRRTREAPGQAQLHVTLAFVPVP